MVIFTHILTHPPEEALAINDTVSLEQQIFTIHEFPESSVDESVLML
jgi:hypothetical protein